MGDIVLLGKSALGLVGAILTIALPTRAFLFRLTNRQFSWLAFAALLASRLALFVLLYLVLNLQVQSDTKDYYDWTKDWLAGKVLYDEIPSCYMPFFHYIIAGAVLVWDSGKSAVLLAILMDLAALLVWTRVSRALFDERITRIATVLYVVNPIAIWSVAAAGQNQVWLMLMLGISLLFLARGRDMLSGAALGASIIVVKFLSMLYAPAVALCSRRPVLWSIAFVAVPFIVYAGYRMGGVDLKDTGRIVASETSSGNLPYMVSLVGVDVRGDGFKRGATLVGAGMLALLCATAAWKLRHGPREPRRAIFLVTLFQVAFMLVSKKSHAFYLEMCFFAVLLTLACYADGPSLRKALWFFAIFLVAGSVEQSLWFRDNWMRMNDFHVLWDAQLRQEYSLGVLALFFLLQLILLGFYLWTFMLSWRLAFAKSTDRVATLTQQAFNPAPDCRWCENGLYLGVQLSSETSHDPRAHGTCKAVKPTPPEVPALQVSPAQPQRRRRR